MRNAAFLLVIAILRARRRGRMVLVGRVAVRESTDDAYVQADVTADQPEDRRLYQGGAASATTSRSTPARPVRHRRPRFRGQGGAGRGGGRDRRGDGRDLWEPARLPAGDDRAGRGGGRPAAEADLRRAAATTAVRSSRLQRLRQPAALRDRRGRRPQGRRRRSPRPAPPSPPSATSSRCLRSQQARGRGAAGAGPRDSCGWRAAISTTR